MRARARAPARSAGRLRGCDRTPPARIGSMGFEGEAVMRKAMCSALLAAVLGTVAGQAFAAPTSDPASDPGVQKLLRAMKDASTWGHPDEFGMFSGANRYARGDYKKALEYFKIGALYADKFSQLSLGLMYMNGEGTSKDPARAYAWLRLAAERDYPDFVKTRDHLAAELSPAQREDAEKIYAELAPTYADASAKPRMANELRRGMAQMTGSRTGYDSGISRVATRQDCGSSVVDLGSGSAPKAGCGGNVSAKERWDPDLYFAARDRQYKGTVEVGEIKETGAPPAPPLPGEGQKH
jgi:hypothetical protein